MQRFGQPKVLSIALTMLVCALYFSAITAPRASAHSVASAQVHAIINGRVYMMIAGRKLTFPITYSNGSKGTISHMANIENFKTAGGDPCHYGSGNTTYYNIFGQTLASYTFYQYWCYNGSTITSINAPYAEWSTYLGWSLANHLESTVFSGVGKTVGESVGTFRFNGPFGIGCKSGRIEGLYYGDGGFSPEYTDGGFYGC